MKITVVGCGHAFSTRNYNQCFMVEETEKGIPRRMLIDFGAKVPYALANLDIDIRSIDDVYISHLHGDHIGGLEEMAFSCYDWAGHPQHYSERGEEVKAPRLIANVQLLNDLWKKSLRGGLESMEGFDANLETYFEPLGLRPNKTFTWQGWTCRLIQQVHIMTGSIISHTFGLMMSREGRETVYFTTDSQHCSPRQIENFYREADIIFQDCECVGVDMEERCLDFMSGVHANYAQLAAWKSANSIDVGSDVRGKMWLSHYQDFVSENKDYRGNSCPWQERAAEDGFRGFAEVGQEMMV